MLLAGLKSVNTENPNWWSVYALATLVRCLVYQRPEFVQRWALWAGGTSHVFLPPLSNRMSTVAIVKDENTAIVACEGTRNVEQVGEEIFGAWGETTNVVDGRVHSFFLACFFDRFQTILDNLDPLPPTANITAVGHSLGGSIAHMLVNAAEKSGLFRINGLVTFGQPRTGDMNFATSTQAPYLRIVNTLDPIPAIPPNWSRFGVLIDHIGGSWIPLRYWHGGDQVTMNVDGSCSILPFLLTNDLPVAIAGLGIDVLRGRTPVSRSHFMSEYIDRLFIRANEADDRPNLLALHFMNNEMDALDENFVEPALPENLIPDAPVFMNPNTQVNAGLENVHAPQGDVNHRVEVRGTSHILFQLGSPDFMANQFRGHDRRLLQTLSKVIKAVIDRDALVGNNVKTRRLSNRIRVLPSNGNPNMLSYATALKAHVDELIAAPRS